MKKKWLSLATVLCLGIGFIGGCGKKDDSFSKLTENNQDIVLKIGENTKYTADDLFKDMLNTENGAKTAYEQILKMIVENTIDTDPNMEASWNLLLESFEEEVESKATSEGISKKEARKSLLAEEGYASIEEKKETYLYEVKLAKLQEDYWDERSDYYYEQYFNSRLPYYVKHVLVKTGYNSARGPYSSVIDSDDAKDLYDVYSLLVKGEKFSYIMNHKSEDTGSSDGTGYHMDLTTSFVTEFLHGVFVLDSLMKGETDKVAGLTTNILSYYVNGALSENGADNDYNFNIIYASDIETLGKNASSSEYNTIYTYENDEEGKEVSVGNLTNSSAYGTTSALHTNTIIFNQTFNNPGISVIAYDLDEDLPENRYITLTIDGEEKKLLTDEKGNLVFVVCALGSSSDLWVHFLTVDVSPFDEKAKLFYSINEDNKQKIIGDMVADYEMKLKADSTLTETQVSEKVKDYKKELEAYQTYVDIKGGETQKGKNEIIEELETIVKTYAKRGITSGTVAGKDQFLTYDMVKYYMDEERVTISNKSIEDLVLTYIENQEELIKLQTVNSIASGWNEYYERVILANSPEINDLKIPMECAYGANNGATCKYNYDNEKGFEIMITYKNVGDSTVSFMPTDSSTYVSSFYIGDGIIQLPGIGTDETNGMHQTGKVFDGWYTTSTFEPDTKVEYIDVTRSSTSNKVILYAKWSEQPTGGDGQ